MFCYNFHEDAGFIPQLLKLDNEVSTGLTDQITADNLDYQLAAPGDHQLNPAERAIQSFKNHFITILAGADEKYPLNKWDLLLEHAETTLNISRPSKFNPKINAYSIIHGTFDFNTTPLAPAGCRTIVHDQTTDRASWAQHGSRGF